jgi:hypothetical protein
MKDSLLGAALLLWVKFQIWVFVLTIAIVVINRLIEAK